MKKNYIEISNDSLVFAFEELGENEKFSLIFNRTLRIPDDNKKYPLPPSLGRFPLQHVEDFSETLPESWQEKGGVFFPMYQAEAMWMTFSSHSGRPYAVKIASGKVNAVSGKVWDNQLHGPSKNKKLPVQTLIHRPQEIPMPDFSKEKDTPDYMVCPNQPWLDGFNVGKGVIRQFVAVPLESGYTVEEQVTGKAEHGGIQVMVYPMKEELWTKMQEEQKRQYEQLEGVFFCASAAPMGGMATRSVKKAKSMGMGAGGMMTQEIYEDPYGIDAWDTGMGMRVFVHLANSEEYKHITGKNPPTKPLTQEDYGRYNFPWFEYYSNDVVLEGSEILSKVDSIGSMQTKKGEKILPDEGHIPKTPVIMLGKKTVKAGKW